MRKRTWAIVETGTVIVMITVFAPGAAAMPAPAPTSGVVYEQTALMPGEVVHNGGGESGDSAGWSAGLDVFQHGVGGYPESVVVDSNGLTGEVFDGGTYLLVGTGTGSTSAQVVDLAPAAAAIDNGETRAVISAYVGGFEGQDDSASVIFEFLDVEGVSTEVVHFGPVYAADRGGVSGYVRFADTVAIPPGVRSARVTVVTNATYGLNDGTVDNVSMKLETPAMKMYSDEAETLPGQQVNVAPLANDFAGAGASLSPDSVRLLSGGQELLLVSTPDGEWEVDPQTAIVRFMPAPGLSSMTTSIDYIARDSSGQHAESSITVNVLQAEDPEVPMEPHNPDSETTGITHMTPRYMPPKVEQVEPANEQSVSLPTARGEAITEFHDAKKRVNVMKSLDVEHKRQPATTGLLLGAVAAAVGTTTLLARWGLVLRFHKRR